MVRSLQRIAEAIDAVIVAEGIETEDDLQVLCELGVRYGQGYFLARPGPPFPRLGQQVKQALFALRRTRRAEEIIMARSVHGEIDDEDGEMRDVTPPPGSHLAVTQPLPRRGSDGEDGSDFAEPTRPHITRPLASKPPPVAHDQAHTRTLPLSETAAPAATLGAELGLADGSSLLGALRRGGNPAAMTSSDPFEEETTGSGGPAN
jgi:hypothetical protein